MLDDRACRLQATQACCTALAIGLVLGGTLQKVLGPVGGALTAGDALAAATVAVIAYMRLQGLKVDP
jgi:hypothetical protein